MYFSVLTNIIVIITVHLAQFWSLKNLGTLHDNAWWNVCEIVSLCLCAEREDTLTHVLFVTQLLLLVQFL